VLTNEDDRGGRQQQVHRDEVRDESRPKAHTGISYFSNRL
jgi:hypothetical protein